MALSEEFYYRFAQSQGKKSERKWIRASDDVVVWSLYCSICRGAGEKLTTKN